ncbi:MULTISPECIES: PAS domain-containing protein [unclassified Sphingomonas]|uniref:PAS domain-containing protein n=1 Tax=unclassified Sphingomonas TaxID=196159 RepID=UPI000E1002F1|nr:MULTISPECIES: PAS domain-containing protein [unclassified Sphingomonas]AXJ94570.1 histidine kinase [Sphingomonas sp. FARSPH]
MTSDVPQHLRDFFDRSHIALALAAAEGDHPLLLVNGPFRALTGYDDQDVIGRNCRMLQGDATNDEPRARIHAFLGKDGDASVRTLLVNFRKDGSPFVNLLYMSKLRALGGGVRYVFASQFDVSRSQPDLLADYDATLGQTLRTLTPVLAESGIVLEGSLMTIANTAATVAQAKLTLSDLDASAFG